MIVYRVENDEKRGPYMNGAFEKWDRHDGMAVDHRPMPSWRYTERVPKGWQARYAFHSTTAFASWFDCPSERRKLAELGYRLAAYEVPATQVIHDDRQVVFDASQATFKEVLPLTPTN